ncbi:MAG: CHASE2 domain-containing protein, partial [Cyanobacteriota bacterium]
MTRKVGSSRPDRANRSIVTFLFTKHGATAAKRSAIAFLYIFALTAALLGIRHQGGLQPLELIAFDKLVRLNSKATVPDPRILVVAITEKDIRSQKKWPFSDRIVAQLLSKLQAMQPAVIGLDLYRDIPIEPGHDELIDQLKQSNLIAIQNIDNVTGTPAPPEVPEERVGFNDLAIDPDNVVRRNILFAENENGALYSFSLRVALAYLEQRNIFLEESPKHPGVPQLGKAVFLRLQKNSGGYQSIETDGYQLLLNYRSPKNLARQVTLTQVLNGEIDPSWVKGKIVIIGSTAPSLKDMFLTPFSPA